MNNSYHHADEVFRSPQGHPLYLGDAQAAEDVAWLRQHDVRTVITAAVGFPFQYDSSIRHITYHLQDKKTENAVPYFDMASFQIHKYLKSNGVLVHCGAGVSRSTTLVIAYLIKYQQMTFLQALKYVKAKRPCVCPNLGFELQLKSYEKTHNQPSTTFMLTTKKREKPTPLPQIVKYNPLHTTVYNCGFRNGSNILTRSSGLNMSKSLKPVDQKEKKQVEYLRKMAEFRFGVTNMNRWRIGQPQSSY